MKKAYCVLMFGPRQERIIDVLNRLKIIRCGKFIEYRHKITDKTTAVLVRIYTFRWIAKLISMLFCRNIPYDETAAINKDIVTGMDPDLYEIIENLSKFNNYLIESTEDWNNDNDIFEAEEP